MDATRMNFKDNAFDIAIDKGTYDALAVKPPYFTKQCGKDKEILRNLIREMVRVSSKAAIVISSGTPDKRLRYLEEFTEN